MTTTLIKFENEKGKWVVRDTFTVSQINYNEGKRCITSLVIANQLGNVVFSMDNNKRADDKNKDLNKNSGKRPVGTAPVHDGFTTGIGRSIPGSTPVGNTNSNMKITANQVKALANKLKKFGIPVEAVLRKHNLSSLEDMDYTLYEQAMLAMVEPDGIVA